MGENRFCTNCGAELVEDATFCVNCGQPVDVADTNPTETAVMPNLQEAFPETQPEPAYPQQPATDRAEIGRASCRKECRSRWSPYH